MRIKLFVVDNKNLFFFYLIADKTLIINATRVISCASAMVHSPRYQAYFDGICPNNSLSIAYITIYQWGKPLWVHSMTDEIFIQSFVPEISTICGNQLKVIFTFGFQEFLSPLTAQSQIIAICKIEAIAKLFLHVC
jgi:hypothetical protein